MNRSREWIRRAVRPENRGLLHFEMGVPEGTKIPTNKLLARRRFLQDGLSYFRPGTAQHRDYLAALRRVNFALNLRQMDRDR